MHRATRDIHGVVAEDVTFKSDRRSSIGALAQCFHVTSRRRAPVVRQRMLHRGAPIGVVMVAALAACPDRNERAFFVAAAEKYSRDYLAGFGKPHLGRDGTGHSESY